MFREPELFTLPAMNALPPSFASPDALRAAFVTGLRRLIGNPDLGALVLVMANACFDPAIRAELETPLRRWFQELASRVRDELRHGRPPDEPPDDLLVFLKLMAIGFDGVRLTRFRCAGPWEIQFNHVRAFRPGRMSTEGGTGVHVPFEPSGFHFNRSFLRKETFWSGVLAGRRVDLLYNKFPFAPVHALLVPERKTNRPQYLERTDLDHLWRLAETLGAALPGVGFGYNSYGAGASVNHLHFQMFMRDGPLPVAAPAWRHNGGVDAYPAHCLRFDRPEEAWRTLEQLHQEAVSYNLICLPGCLYCLPRKRPGDCRPPDWSGVFAWYELAGAFTTFNSDAFGALRTETIEAALGAVSLVP